MIFFNGKISFIWKKKYPILEGLEAVKIDPSMSSSFQGND